LLDAYGYQVEAATNGEEGVHLLQAIQPDIEASI
jgi:hypothetical protein